MDALRDGQSWIDSNLEADAEEIKEKHREIDGICAPIVSKYYGALEIILTKFYYLIALRACRHRAWSVG